MADISSPTQIVDGRQALTTVDDRVRRLFEEQLMRDMAAQANLMDPSRGFEIR